MLCGLHAAVLAPPQSEARLQSVTICDACSRIAGVLVSNTDGCQTNLVMVLDRMSSLTLCPIQVSLVNPWTRANQ